MKYLLNGWYGLDYDGKPLAPDDTEYDETGRYNAARLRIKDQKELDAKKAKEKAEKKEKKDKKKKARADKAKKDKSDDNSDETREEL